jgi:tRNA pseudouridine38-40 synthase
MARYKLTIEFDGTPFCGWQRQDNGLSVQGALEDAAFRYCGHKVRFHAAGRTDSGVHGLGMVVHADMGRNDSADRVRQALNALVRPHPVVVVAAEMVDDAFHARFSCLERAYIYRILCRPSPPALDAGRVWWLPKVLDAEAMDQAAKVLVGKHDFSSFRAAACQSKSPLKTLDQLDVEQQGEEIRVYARARSFLHHQVRNMVGSLALVGQGKWTAADLETALKARDRAAAGATAPAQGLYFRYARYPDDELNQER